MGIHSTKFVNNRHDLKSEMIFIYNLSKIFDRLCGPVVRVPRYRSIGPRFDSQPYQIFWEVVGLARSPLSLVSTIEEVLVRRSCRSGLEIREFGCRDHSRWRRETVCPQKMALTSPANGDLSVSTFCLRTKATKFNCSFIQYILYTLTLSQ
jgi:hypothetical protein